MLLNNLCLCGYFYWSKHNRALIIITFQVVFMWIEAHHQWVKLILQFLVEKISFVSQNARTHDNAHLDVWFKKQVKIMVACDT